MNSHKNAELGDSQRSATGAFPDEPRARCGYAADVRARGASGAAIQCADPSAPHGGTTAGACCTAGTAGGAASGATVPSHRGPVGTSTGAAGAAGEAAATAGLAPEVREGWLSLRSSSDQGYGFKILKVLNRHVEF